MCLFHLFGGNNKFRDRILFQQDLGYPIQHQLCYTHLLYYTDEIRNAVFIIPDDKAYSYYFEKDVSDKVTGDNKKFLTIEEANHTSFDEMKAFLERICEKENPNIT